jgi:hypothetical protein
LLSPAGLLVSDPFLISCREREEITERKKSLACLMSNIAEIGGSSVRDAIIGTGVAIDKMLALTGQSPVGKNQQCNQLCEVL